MARKNAKTIRWHRETRAEHLPDVLTVHEAARYLGVGRNSAYDAARRGEIPTVRIGRRLLVPRAALERLLSEVEAQSNG